MAKVGPVTRFMFCRNTASIMKIWSSLIFRKGVKNGSKVITATSMEQRILCVDWSKDKRIASVFDPSAMKHAVSGDIAKKILLLKNSTVS